MSWTISIINVAPDGRKDVLESYRYKTLAEACVQYLSSAHIHHIPTTEPKAWEGGGTYVEFKEMV